MTPKKENEFARQAREDAAKLGRTLEEELALVERYGSKSYADLLRTLYGIPICSPSPEA